MQSKSLLIAIAALAVTATGVHVHAGGNLLNRTNLSEGQKVAIEQAAHLRAEGNLTAARDVLVEAGFDENALLALRKVASTAKLALKEAVERGDYESFRLAISGLPLSDVITTEADFMLFKEAHDFHHLGSHQAATKILNSLGVEPGQHGMGHGNPYFHRFDALSDDEREALRVAKQANDRKTVRAILKDAGID